jgi:hypothetical protein
MGLAPGTRNKATVSIRDAGNEIGKFSCTGPDVVAANLDDVEALWETLTAAIAALTLGAITKTNYVNEVTQATTQPTDGAAREIKLLVQYQVSTGANTGARWTCTVPCLDTTKVSYVVNVNAKDVVDPSVGTQLLAFIAAFEAFAVDPANGTGEVVVVGLKVVGRNN